MGPGGSSSDGCRRVSGPKHKHWLNTHKTTTKSTLESVVLWPPDSLCKDLVLFVELVPGGEKACDVLGHFHVLLQIKARRGKY